MPSNLASAASAAVMTPQAGGAKTALSQAIPARKRWLSPALFGTEREIEIEHAGQLYRLRQTSLGKLILTK